MKKTTTKKQEYTLESLTKGLDVTIQGNPHTKIVGICTIQNSIPDHLTFLTNSSYRKFLYGTKAAAVILSPEDAKSCTVDAIISLNPTMVYAKIASHFYKKPKSSQQSNIHPTVIIGKNAQIASSAIIGAYCVIGEGVSIGENVVIGPQCTLGDNVFVADDTIIEARVTIYYDVQIGMRCQISSGVVIGSDGFGLARENKTWYKIPQLGSVVIGDEVEIGSNCTLDRGAVENTVIENGVKLDNLIQVGHNVRIGENTVIAGCVGIAGSATIGKNCMIGGACGIGGHISIVDNVIITGMTAVSKSIKEPGVYSSGVGGLVTNEEWRKNSARFHRLDQLMDRIKNLEAKARGRMTEEVV